MKDLQYPFNADYILSNKKKIKRELLLEKDLMIKKNIAILGGFTTKDITLTLELFLLDNKINPCFYESEYNKYYEDAIFENEELDKFKPDIIYICTSNRNIDRFPTLKNSINDIDNMLDEQYKKYESIWESIEKKYNCVIIQNNFEMPFYRLLGNLDAVSPYGKTNFISRLNNKFYEYANKHNNFFICDLNYISADFGLDRWYNMSHYYMYKYAMSVQAIPYLSFNVSNIIKSIYGKNKKGFVLDLDNTLWGGVIGDDGIENILLGKEVAEGEAYIEFQKYLKEHKDLGIVLNINSKNDESNAYLGLSHPNSILKKDDFIEIIANWDSKDRNFIEISNNLSLGADSLLFIDDNKFERHIVEEQLKGVIAPEISDVSDYIKIIDRGGYFESTVISSEDTKRVDMYRENAERTKFKSQFRNYSEFLLSLEMKSEIKSFDLIHLARITQLINKSNQFNLTTQRFTQLEIEDIRSNNEYITLYGDLKDKFGDNGIVSVLIGKIEKNQCHIILWIMSCRVLKRDMEYAMMDEIVKKCREKNINEIYGYFYPTTKNSIVSDFYDKMGFSLINEDDEGNKTYKFFIDDKYKEKNKIILITTSSSEKK